MLRGLQLRLRLMLRGLRLRLMLMLLRGLRLRLMRWLRLCGLSGLSPSKAPCCRPRSSRGDDANHIIHDKFHRRAIPRSYCTQVGVRPI